MSFELIKKEIQRGEEGKNNSIPMGFDRLNKYVSLRKRVYTLIFGSTGSGKSAFVHDAFILNPFDWWIENKNKTPLKIKGVLFSQERSKVYTLSKWLSRKIFLDQGVMIPIPKMLGWWDTKLSLDEHDLIEMFEDYINELCEVFDIVEGPQNPTGVYKYIKNFHESRGRVEEIDAYHKIYIPNDENEIFIPINDHLGLTRPEKGMSKKEAIDKVSEHFQYARDFYGDAPVGVSQVNRDLSNPIYQKMDSFEPNLDQVKESGRPAEDSDCVISLFQPSRYKTSDPSYIVDKFINPESGGDYFRKIKILKNTYGESDLGVGMAFCGPIGAFKELPKKRDMESFDYTKLFDNSYFLK